MGKPVPADVEHAEAQAALVAVPHVAFYDPAFYEDCGYSVPGSDNNEKAWGVSPRTKNGSSPGNPAQKQKINEFYRMIAVCHEVVPERLEDGSIKLSAPNPDDEALVCAAAFFGYSFRDRRDRVCLVHEGETDKLLEITVLYTIPFSSARQRMSVIIRDIDGQIKIATKGADSMMYTRLDVNSPQNHELRAKTERDINQFAVEGLRCLVVASAVIDDRKFNEWSRHYDEANTNLVELDKRKRGEPNDIDKLEGLIETNLHLIGATAIEDRLQDGVPQCVEKLLQADIKIWVLTGDKQETAINIAVACNLVLPNEYMEQVIVNKGTASNIEAAVALFTAEIGVCMYLEDVYLFIYLFV
jgi:phospholipid-transporting ATPase